MQFCQGLFLKKYICDIIVVDKIEIGVYNVHRNPRGAFTPILDLFLEVPPRVFLGILSEYLAQKYSPELVNKNFGDFLVTGYIYTMGVVGVPLQPLGVFYGNPRQPLKKSINFLSNKLVHTLGGFR
jgi:hypothetical protein